MIKPNRLTTALAIALTTVSLVVLPHVLHAKAASDDRVLTAKAVEQFVASFPDVKSIAIKYAKDKKAEVKATKKPLVAVIAAVSDGVAVKEVDKTVQTYGFKGSGEWVAVADKIARAYAHIKTGGQSSKAQRKLKKAIGKIEKNDFLSDGQKAKLVEALRHNAGALDAPPPENVEVVKPMMAQIDAVMQ